MAVSVLINTRNRPDFLRFVLGKIAPLFRCGDDLVIVDDGSDPALSRESLAAWVGEGVPISLVRNDEACGLIRARNLGIRAAQGEFVLQLDDDSWPVAEHAFDRVEAGMARYPGAGALAFPVHEHWSRGKDEVGSRYPRCRLPDGMRDFAFIGCGAALRRQVVLEAGGYPEYGTYGSEEEALGLRLWRLGYEIRVCHAVCVIHGHEVLSRSTEYRVTRQSSAYVELASNRLCGYRENLPWLAWYMMGLAELVSLCVKGRAGLVAPVLSAYRAKRPRLRIGTRLAPGPALRWILCRTAVLWRLRLPTSPSRGHSIPLQLT